jgi:hypothetical protein
MIGVVLVSGHDPSLASKRTTAVASAGGDEHHFLEPVEG